MPHYLLGQIMFNWFLAHHAIVDNVTRAIAICSLLHTVLPPWDWNPDFVSVGLSEFPTAQLLFRKAFNNRWYRILIYSLGYVALNGRSTVWRFISVKNVDGPNANVNAANPEVKANA